MELKTKHFKIATQTENFVAVKYIGKRFGFNIEHYLELYEEMEAKGYTYYCDGEFSYFIFRRINAR